MNSANTALSRATGGGSRVLERDKLTLLAAPPPWRINNNARRNIIMKDRWDEREREREREGEKERETSSLPERTRGLRWLEKFLFPSRFLPRNRSLVARRVRAFFHRNLGDIKKRRDAYRPRVPSPLYITSTRRKERERERDRERSLSIRKTNGGRSRREIERIRSPSGKLIVSLLTNRRGRVRVVTDVARAKWPSSSFAAWLGSARLDAASRYNNGRLSRLYSYVCTLPCKAAGEHTGLHNSFTVARARRFARRVCVCV